MNEKNEDKSISIKGEEIKLTAVEMARDLAKLYLGALPSRTWGKGLIVIGIAVERNGMGALSVDYKTMDEVTLLEAVAEFDDNNPARWRFGGNHE